MCPTQVLAPHLAPMVLLRALPPDRVLPRKMAGPPNASSAVPSADLVDSLRPTSFSGAPPAQPLALSPRRPSLGGSRPPVPSTWSSHNTAVRGEREPPDGSGPDVESREASSSPRRLRLPSPPLPTRVRNFALGGGCRPVAACDSFGGPRRGGDFDSDRSSARIQLNPWGQGSAGESAESLRFRQTSCGFWHWNSITTVSSYRMNTKHKERQSIGVSLRRLFSSWRNLQMEIDTCQALRHHAPHSPL